MFIAEIDGSDLSSVKGFLFQMDKAFGFPPNLEEDWDVLLDCMKDLYWIDDTDFTILITNSYQLIGKTKVKVVSFLNEIKEYWEDPKTEPNYTLKIQFD